MPLISVITVVYNGAATLERTILSILEQTYPHVEYIIIDGGSTDGSLDIIKKYSEHIAYWVSEPDEGIYDAMNKGVQRASGEWILFMGADDILYNVLHTIVPELTNKDTIYYGDVHFGSTAKVYNGRYNKYKLSIANICHQSIFYPARVFQIYKYDLNYPVYADYALNLQCWADRRFRFKYLPVVVSLFAWGGASLSTNSMKDWRFERDKMSLIRTNLFYDAYLYAMFVKHGLFFFHMFIKRK